MSKKWNSVTIDLGEVKEKSNIKFEYVEVSPSPEVQQVLPGCGSCTRATYKDGKIEVVFTADSIPIHIALKQKFQIVTKTIKVLYKDGTEDILIFNAKIIKK